MGRITTKQLEAMVKELNEIVGVPTEPYTKAKDGTINANIGTYYISGAYGGWALEKIVTTGGGVTRISHDGYGTKHQLSKFLDGFLATWKSI